MMYLIVEYPHLDMIPWVVHGPFGFVGIKLYMDFEQVTVDSLESSSSGR
ncbi:hypothetical protein OROMI_009503 [Orobanche minor]